MDKPLTTCKALAAGAAVVTAVTIGADEGKPTNNSPDLGKAHLHVARPTDNWVAVVKFYRDGLGFEVLYEFKDHDGFDGVMLGGKGRRITWSSPAGLGTKPAAPRPRTICWSSTCPIGPDGWRRWPRWRTLGTNR